MNISTTFAIRGLLGLALLCVLAVPQAFAVNWQALDLENTLIMQLKDGKVIIVMRPDKAPNHVARIKELVRQKFYDGLTFHRVIDGFMAQTGDPNGDGTGGSGQNLRAEFNSLRHYRGAVSMARSEERNSADSQFFFMLNANFSLDRQYTVWGRVVEGMQYVDNIKKGSSYNDGAVIEPDRIITLHVAADIIDPNNLPTD